MIVLIDNYDSFTFNLFHYLSGLGAKVVVHRNDKIAADDVIASDPDAIVLRTALVKDGTMYVQAGAGIVADSDPKSEQQECINKAKALFRAAEEARRFASAARRGQ